MFEDQMINIFEEGVTSVPQMMKTDIQEKDGNYLLEIDLPGFSREDVQAELVDGKLTIIANRKRDESIEKDETKIHYIRRERFVAGCKRTFYVGKKIRQEDIQAAFKDGVLNIIISNPDIAVEKTEIKLIPIQ